MSLESKYLAVVFLQARLLEVQLAEQLNLSRGTIRSALQQLTHEGLVVQFPYKGCAVPALSSQDAWGIVHASECT